MASLLQQELIVRPGKNGSHYWRELWKYRELFLFLSWRDILVRYKQTALGIAWGVIRPFLAVAVFVIVFGRVAKLPSDGIPYPILVYAAMLPWQLFAASLHEGSVSLIANAGMISKVYFPRIIIPATSIIVNLVDFFISFFVFIGLMAYYGIVPQLTFVALPAFLVLVMMLSFGASLWTSSLNVRYRDFRYIIPFALQFGLYISPVGFSSNIIPEKWRFIYSLNPMVGVIDGFRWAIIGNSIKLYFPSFFLSIGLSLFLFVTGFWYFKNNEGRFVDVI